MIDQTDLEIIKCLQENSRMQWKDIGKKVHLTGQAVAGRLRKLEDMGAIVGYTIKVNPDKLGKPITAFITAIMKNSDHAAFQRFIASREIIIEAHRISGDGCYWLQANLLNPDELNKLLDEILKYANYRISLSIGRVK